MGEGRVLKSIIQNNQAGTGRGRRPAACQPITSDPGRRKGGVEEGFVSDFVGGVASGFDPQGSRQRAPVSPGENMRAVPGGCKPRDQLNDGRCLSGPPDADVSDTNDRNADPSPLTPSKPPPDGGGPQPGEGQKSRRQGTWSGRRSKPENRRPHGIPFPIRIGARPVTGMIDGNGVDRG